MVRELSEESPVFTSVIPGAPGGRRLARAVLPVIAVVFPAAMPFAQVPAPIPWLDRFRILNSVAFRSVVCALLEAWARGNPSSHSWPLAAVPSVSGVIR